MAEQTEKIEPVLTADDFAVFNALVPVTLGADIDVVARHRTVGGGIVLSDRGDGEVTVWPEDIPKLIALANHALPDNDRRKITRAMVAEIRWAGENLIGTRDGERLVGIADALESYLHPR